MSTTATAAIKTAAHLITVQVWGKGTDWYASIPVYSDRPQGPCVHSRTTSRQAALCIVRTARADVALSLMGKWDLDVVYTIRNAIYQNPSISLAKLVKLGSDAYDRSAA